jgi:transposase
MPLADPTYIGQVASVTGAIVRVRLREDMPSTLVASSHRHELVRGVGLPLIGLPPYSPELNPAERVFEEVRRWIEGKVYPSLEDKVAAVAAYLTELESNPDRVRGLAGWDWIEDTIRRLPASRAFSMSTS